MSKYEHFGPPEAPGPFGGFSGPPNQDPTDGSREPHRGADRQSDAVARDPSKGDDSSSVRRSPGDSQLRTPDEDSGSSSRPARRRTTKLFFKTSPARESRSGIRCSNLTTVKKFTYEFSRSNQEAGRELRAQTSDERSLNRYRRRSRSENENS